MPSSAGSHTRPSNGGELNADENASRAGSSSRVSVRLRVALPLLMVGLVIAVIVGLYVGYQPLSIAAIKTDPIARAVFLRLRLPRVIMAGIIGASLAMVGAALQALFRNPLADPFTLGVSGGASLGASVAIAFGFGLNLVGVPFIFIAAFAGAAVSVLFVYRLARSGGGVMLPGALLLAGVVLNLSASAGVLVIQYLATYGRALQILRWLIGSLDVVGFDLIWKMLVFLVPGWLVLLAHARDLHLLATGEEESAASLGVDVRRTERGVFLASSLIVAVTVSVGGAIGFVGLIVPHAARLVFGQDVRVLLPASFLLGGAFLILADTLARVAISPGELPVGAITALLGGPVFLLLLKRQQRYSAM
ncbi:MAG TPA: iron ABC transporter permease [Pyrinomonadaceae bacterium]|nr:iron ABC transporter permease [Pyrinomonadaceae bacterium]